MGDWDGNGSRTPGHRIEGGHFKLGNTLPPGAPTIDITFGDPRGFPVVGDLNDDGIDDVAVYPQRGVGAPRREGRAGSARAGTVGLPAPFTFGTGSWPATIPVAGDWDNDGLDGIGHYTTRPVPGSCARRPRRWASISPAFTYWAGAASGSYAVVGDWNTDGTDSVGVKASTPAG